MMLSAGELGAGLAWLGLRLEEDQLHDVLRGLDEAGDGMVSLVEWKRFCKLVEQSGLSFYDFVKCYAIGAY